MLKEEESPAMLPPDADAASSRKKLPLTAVFICAALSVFFLNSPLLIMFFLVPLGYAVIVCGSAWTAFAAAAAANIVFSLTVRLIHSSISGAMLIEFFYYTLMFLCFAWIVGGDKFTNIRTAYRFLLSSAVITLVFCLMFVANGKTNSAYSSMLAEAAEMLSSAIASSSGGGADGNYLLKEMAEPEKMIKMMKGFFLRGGVMAGIAFLFFINRQIALTAALLIKKQRNPRGLASFYAPSEAVWVLSCSLAVILLARIFKLEIPEIMAWNVFVVCAILFLAQGAGIVMYMLAHKGGIFRFAAGILIIFLLFSPALNTVAVAALLLLGIAENWLPFRAAKQGQASTPKPPDYL